MGFWCATNITVTQLVDFGLGWPSIGMKSNPLNFMKNLEYDAMAVMEQIHMAESRHMQMGALVSYQLQYPDMTIRDFFGMAATELEEQEEDI